MPRPISSHQVFALGKLWEYVAQLLLGEHEIIINDKASKIVKTHLIFLAG